MRMILAIATTMMLTGAAYANGSIHHNNFGGSEANSSSSSSAASTSVSNSGSVSQAGVSIDQDIEPGAPAAVGPGLSASAGSCMGSTSAGGSSPFFGFSLGTTWTDETCVAINEAAALDQLGYREAALDRLCMVPSMRKALKGYRKCPAPAPAADAGAPDMSAKADVE